MSETVIVFSMFFGVIVFLAILRAAYCTLSDCGFFVLIRVKNGIKSEQLKAKHKELLEGKYL